jgi:hypothetical protein
MAGLLKAYLYFASDMRQYTCPPFPPEDAIQGMQIKYTRLPIFVNSNERPAIVAFNPRKNHS